MHTDARHTPRRRPVVRSLTLLVSTLATLWISGPSSAEDLQTIYQLARDYDAEIQAARHDHSAALQRLPLARSAFRPQINTGFEAGISDASPDNDGSYSSTQLSLSISQTLFNRSNSALLDQAELGILQADAQLKAQEQALILRVANAYFNVLRAQANVEFSQSELQAIGRQREQAERRFDVGLVPITDVRDAQAQYDLAIAQEIAASNNLTAAREALLVVSGTNPELLAGLANDLPLVAPNPANIDDWVQLALDQNLELVAARLQAQSAQTGIDVQRGARFPTVDLVGVGATSTTEQLGREDTDAGEIRLELALPIYSGGRISAQVAQARAESLAASERLLSQERATTQQARDGYRGVMASISRVRALRQALVSTQKSAEATEAGFRAGTRTSVDVLRALRDTYAAQSDYAAARYDYIINTLNLKAAAGTLNDADLVAINKFLLPAD